MTSNLKLPCLVIILFHKERLRTLWGVCPTTAVNFFRICNFFIIDSFLILTFAYSHVIYFSEWGTRWRSWLRHCAKSRKVAGSIPDGVIDIILRVDSASNRNKYQ